MRFFTAVILLCVGLVAASPFDDSILVSCFTFNPNNYSLLLALTPTSRENELAIVSSIIIPCRRSIKSGGANFMVL
jgi:hypothetical protein